MQVFRQTLPKKLEFMAIVGAGGVDLMITARNGAHEKKGTERVVVVVERLQQITLQTRPQSVLVVDRHTIHLAT